MNTTGLAGYASLMKTQKNPYERNIATTANVMNSMPKDGGVTGLEGLGRIPLMYAMGRDTANAQAFDQQQEEQEQGYLSQVMQAEREKTIQEGKDKAMQNYIKLASVDPNAANQLAEGDPTLKSILPPGMRIAEKMNKDGWLTIEGLSEDGKSKTIYQMNIGGIKIAGDKLKEQGITGAPTVEQLAANMPEGYAFKLTGAASAAKEQTDKPQGERVRDPNSPTGWSYLTEQGNMISGAPDPYKGKEGAGGGDERKSLQDFEGWYGKLNTLRSKRATIQQGYYVDSTGQKIAVQDIQGALREIDGQISGIENIMKSNFPKEYGTAFPPQTPQGKVLDQATAAFILKNAGGDKELARKMAREQGYSF